MDLSQLLDSFVPEGLAVDKQPTGYTASVFYGMEGAEGQWSPRVFAGTASEAIAKALKLHGVRPVVSLAPPSRSDASVPISPPPY